MNPEIVEYLKAIEQVRGKIWETLESAPAEAWNWTPTSDATNSLFVIATHSIGSEHGWIYEILGNGDKTRNRSAEFFAEGSGLDQLRAKFQEVGQETRALLETHTPADLSSTRTREGHGEVTERWILLHVISHSSEHLGQMYLTKQLWEQKRD